MDYERVEEALSKGVEPAMLCATCPWDRHCLTRPESTKADYEAKLAEATAKDKADAQLAQAEGKPVGMPVGMLLTAVALGGRHQSMRACPVLLVRIQSSQGNVIAARTKHMMQNEWVD
jgi:hypothetical protein